MSRIVTWILAVFLGTSPALAQSPPQTVRAEAGTLAVESWVSGLDGPWGAAFLPDGRMLVTEKSGALRLIPGQGQKSQPLRGVPEVVDRGQGGLLDVALDPDFAANRYVYLTYSEGRDGGVATSAGRGRLTDDASALEDFQVIFRQKPAVNGPNHFGSRLAFAPDGTLFVTLGERFNFMNEAQNPSNTLGAIVRINPDGTIPKDNPFVGKGGDPAIWSYGHRNVEGAAINPASGQLWTSEMGPRGGDELNIPKAGANHGWPVVSHGTHYSGVPIPDPATRPEFVDAIRWWVPSISPSGIAFVTRDSLPGWRGSLLLAGLSYHGLVRLSLDGDRVVAEERIDFGRRIRDVLIGPDGALYVLTDGKGGRILRLTAAGG